MHWKSNHFARISRTLFVILVLIGIAVLTVTVYLIYYLPSLNTGVFPELIGIIGWLGAAFFYYD
jgi:hypothetical protein